MAGVGVRDPDAVRAPRSEDPRLKELCGEFEGIFLGILLKEGLSGSPSDDEEEDAGGRMLLESAIEHTARDMGREDGMGLGQALYESIRDRP
jgi:hypothetical protein